MSPYVLATWASVIVLGPGAVAVFLWFVSDLARMRRRHANDAHRSE